MVLAAVHSRNRFGLIYLSPLPVILAAVHSRKRFSEIYFSPPVVLAAVNFWKRFSEIYLSPQVVLADVHSRNDLGRYISVLQWFWLLSILGKDSVKKV